MAELIIYAFGIYLAIGALFALWFVTFGVSKLDDSTIGTTAGFRFLIFFGTAAFWVVFTWRLMAGRKRPIERNAHRRRAKQQ